MSPHFKRDELRERYDVEIIDEDEWHTYATAKTYDFLWRHLSRPKAPQLCLNAGAGVYELRLEGWEEVSIDLFITPMRGRRGAVCASVEALPFKSETFGGIVCTGEVLAYCDPVTVFAEFSRIAAPSGVLICDFGNSRSFRYWFRSPYGRAADLVTDLYNGKPERIWVYEPRYVESLLGHFGFDIKMILGTHTWSALARRCGASMSTSLFLQHRLERVRLPSLYADVITIIASRRAKE